MGKRRLFSSLSLRNLVVLGELEKGGREEKCKTRRRRRRRRRPTGQKEDEEREETSKQKREEQKEKVSQEDLREKSQWKEKGLGKSPFLEK